MSSFDVRHEEETFKIYYYHVDSFEESLPEFGGFLESLEKNGEAVVSIVTNTGLVGSSLLLGSSFQGVKGFGVVTRKIRR